MRKPLPGAVNRLLEGDLNRGEKVAGERGWSAAVLMSSSTRNKRFLFVLCCVSVTAMENVSDKINSIMLDYKYSSWPLIQGSCLEDETGGETIEEVATVLVRYGAWPKPRMLRVSQSLTLVTWPYIL